MLGCVSAPDERPHLFAGHDGRLDGSDGGDGQTGGGRDGSAHVTTDVRQEDNPNISQ